MYIEDVMFPNVLNPANLTGSNGFKINVAAQSASGIGDINADGIADIGIGFNGGAYVIFGSGQSWPAEFDINGLNGKNGFEIYNLQGTGISKLGDINADGIDDFILGDHSENYAYVVFGSKTIFPNPFNVLELNGQNGFKIQGNENDDIGFSISNANDINNDGINDILIACPEEESYEHYMDNAYVLYGAKQFSPSISLAQLNGQNGFIIANVNSWVYGGWTIEVSSGDFNHDNNDDIIIGSFTLAEAMNGCCITVIYTNTSMPAVINAQALNNDTGYVSCIAAGVVDGSTELVSISGGQDLNGDGIEDAVLGCANSDNGGGRAVVYFGAKNNAEVTTVTITKGGINGISFLGASVAMVPDINGDNIPDLLVGAPTINTYPYVGVMYGHNLSEPFLPTISSAELIAGNGFTITYGYHDSSFGWEVNSAGDINNDKINDIIIADNFHGDIGTVSECVIVFGETNTNSDLNI
jgi:hypothetical protein